MSKITPYYADVIYTREVDVLADGEEIDVGFEDFEHVDKLQLTYKGDAANLTLVQTSKMQENSTSTQVVTLPLSLTNDTLVIPSRFRFARYQIQNNTGSDVTNVGVQLKVTYGSSDKASVLSLSFPPIAQSQALLTQSVAIGKDAGGVFRQTGVNEAGATLVSDFGTEVARNLYSGYSINTKFGRNPEIGTSTTPEDIYNGGGEYTGFNATANENISVTSADANDSGSLVSSGTATGGSNTTLIDTNATFVTDGVAVGDAVLNDTQGTHGIVTAVTQTQLTVFGMVDGISDDIANVSGDSYRVATADDTGAAVLKLKNILNENYEEQTDVYIIMNGTTTVTTTGVDAMRCPKGRVILAGTSGRNEGEITVTQSTTTANVFCVIPTFGSTTIGAFTVPAGKDCIIKRVLASIVRSSGAAGSATVVINTRMFGQAFTAERVYELQASAPIEDNIIGGIALPPGTDIKGTVENVSDNSTIAQINIEYFLIDR